MSLHERPRRTNESILKYQEDSDCYSDSDLDRGQPTPGGKDISRPLLKPDPEPEPKHEDEEEERCSSFAPSNSTTPTSSPKRRPQKQIATSAKASNSAPNESTTPGTRLEPDAASRKRKRKPSELQTSDHPENSSLNSKDKQVKANIEALWKDYRRISQSVTRSEQQKEDIEQLQQEVDEKHHRLKNQKATILELRQRKQALTCSVKAAERELKTCLTAPQNTEQELKDAHKTALSASQDNFKEMKDIYESELAILRNRIQELEDAVKEDSLRVSRDDEIQALASHNTRMRARLFDFFEANIPDANENKVSDDQIIMVWRTMSYSIRQFVGQALTRRPDAQDKPEGAHDCEGVFRLMEFCCKHPELRALALQGHIWRMIESQIFQSKSKCWGGRLGYRLVNMCSPLPAENPRQLEILSEIKSRAAQHLDQESGINTVNVRNLAVNIAHDLFIFTSAPDNERNVEQLSKIFTQAAELQAIFMKSRALFSVALDPADYGPWDVDLDRQDIIHSSNTSKAEAKCKIHLRVSPLLEKIGNADGEHLDRRMVLCRAQVTVK